jgi:hypothetical protein
MPDTLKVEGRCHCGAIRYRAEVDPEMVGICHCTDCRTLTGSAFRVTVRALAERFEIEGEPRRYLKTADSGNQRVHAFCGDCGAPIYAAAPDNPPNYSLRVGALDRAAQLVPRRQIWCDSGLAWAQDISGIPGSPKG